MRLASKRNQSGMLTYVFPLQCAVFSYVFTQVLTQKGNIFGFYGDFLENVYQRWQWLAKPLGWCGKCFAGQVAFWAYLNDIEKYSAIEHAMSICWAIIFYIILDKWLKN